MILNEKEKTLIFWAWGVSPLEPVPLHTFLVAVHLAIEARDGHGCCQMAVHLGKGVRSSCYQVTWPSFTCLTTTSLLLPLYLWSFGWVNSPSSMVPCMWPISDLVGYISGNKVRCDVHPTFEQSGLKLCRCHFHVVEHSHSLYSMLITIQLFVCVTRCKKQFFYEKYCKVMQIGFLLYKVPFITNYCRCYLVFLENIWSCITI